MLNNKRRWRLLFTIRPAGSSVSEGGFAVVASGPREALEQARAMLARGLADVEVEDATGKPYDLAELERMTAEIEAYSPV
jgi:hypothetical protein